MINKLLIPALALLLCIACEQDVKTRQFGEKRKEFSGHVYALDGNQTLKIRYLDSASIKYELVYNLQDSAGACKDTLEGEAVYMNPETDLESDEDTDGSYAVEEFVHETQAYFLTVRLQYPEKKKARVQVLPVNKAMCLPSDKVMVKQEVQ